MGDYAYKVLGFGLDTDSGEPRNPEDVTVAYTWSDGKTEEHTLSLPEVLSGDKDTLTAGVRRFGDAYEERVLAPKLAALSSLEKLAAEVGKAVTVTADEQAATAAAGEALG